MYKSLKNLKNYASFLLEKQLDFLTSKTIAGAKERDLPLLKQLSGFSDDQLFELTRNGYLENILTPLIEDHPFDYLLKGVEKWKADTLIVSKKAIQIQDVISIHQVRKAAFLDALGFYNVSGSDLLELVKEINYYFDACIDIGLKAYEEIKAAEIDEKNEMLSGILSNFPVIVTRINKVGEILFSKGQGLTQLGYDEDSLIGKNIFDQYPNAENTRKALEGNSVAFFADAISATGEKRKFRTFYVPEKYGVMGFSIDVTQQQKAEERFINLIESVKDYAIFMLTPEGNIASWNEGARRFKQYEKQEIIGKHFSIFYPEDKKKSKFPEYELEQAIAQGRFEDEGLRIRKDGSTFWANVLISPIYDAGNNLLGFTKITRDLTEQKLAEEKLRRSEERYRLLIDAVSDYAIFMVNPEGVITSWNEGAKRLKGYSEEEILGKPISVFYTPEKIQENYPGYELDQAKLHGRFVDEGIRVRKDGSTFFANVIITALYDANRNLIGYSKITRDLTERKRYEEELHKMNQALEEKVNYRTHELSKTIEELQKINNDLDNFIYTASHDLKAPISNLEGLIDALYEELEEHVKTNPNLESFKGLLSLSIKKFQGTIRDLTEIAKIQKGSGEPADEINTTELLEDIKLTLREPILKLNVEILSDWDGCGTIKFVNRNLKSIFSNLIHNAIKYRHPERTPKIYIRCSIVDHFQVISFTDNGLGIRQEHLSKIFEMFRRAHDHVEGSGVGLYIVKRIIENAGGKIEVESVVNEGTTFRVFIPNF